MYKNFLTKSLVIGVLLLFFGAGLFPTFSGLNTNKQDSSTLTFYTFDKIGSKKCKVELPTDVAQYISSLFESLKAGITSDPFSANTESLKNDFVEILDIYNVIPKSISKNDVISLLKPRWNRLCVGDNPISRINVLPEQYSHRGSAFLCSIAGGGSGMMLPPIILPRPRFANVWMAYNSYAGTIASNLYTGHGFAAIGSQFGIAFGFWGIGLSFAVPGEPAVFGFGGYALAAFVGAEDIETYPPNQVPIITEEQPSDGSVDVPLSLADLSFRISDGDDDRMSYTVTTDPDIGSGSGNNVVDGIYSIPVSGLNSNSMYSWHVVVSDSEDVTEETFSFRTANEAPFISDPLPIDGDDWVSINITELSFRLEDFQGDLMDFSVETVPDIGSGSGNDVGDGVYSVDVKGLKASREYFWFVNATDGEHWTHRIFSFKTQPLMIFDPFNEGWNFRKKITIDHFKVAGDLSDFPMVISLEDSDLAAKAQDDGDDILFMDGSGVSNRLFHEIEFYNSSNGELVAWVNVDELSGSSDTDLYIYYGNLDSICQEYPNKVWDSNYQAVWHLSEDGTGLRYDSTCNNNDGNPYEYDGDEAVTGQIDGADDFDGINDEIKVKNDPSLNFHDTNQYSISLWIKRNDLPFSDSRSIISKGTSSLYSGYNIALSSNKRISTRLGDGTKTYYCLSNIFTDTGIWYHIVKNWDGNSLYLYINGNLENSTYLGDVVIKDDSKSLQIGNHWWDHWFPGIIDEIRISDTPRSSDWISTEYYNQNDPLDFYSIGPEESAP